MEPIEKVLEGLKKMIETLISQGKSISTVDFSYTTLSDEEAKQIMVVLKKEKIKWFDISNTDTIFEEELLCMDNINEELLSLKSKTEIPREILDINKEICKVEDFQADENFEVTMKIFLIYSIEKIELNKNFDL